MTCQFFEFNITSGEPRDIIETALAGDGTSMINTINANAFNVALEDPAFHDALVASDTLVADGIGVVWAAWLCGARGIGKIAGNDLFEAAMAIANERRLTVGFLGSMPEVLELIVTNAASDYPNVFVKVLSPPFVSGFADEEAIELTGQLGDVDILFIGMTAPKQEKFAHQVRDAANARVIVAIGAVFDFYAGTTKRAHPLMIRLGLEWLGRSLADPRRLGKRNLVAIPTFLFNVVRRAVRGKRRPRVSD